MTAPIISLSSSFPDRYMFESMFLFAGLQPFSSLGSIRELPALSRHAIKLSEGKDAISKK